MRFKRSFTDPVPKNNEQSFANAWIGAIVLANTGTEGSNPFSSFQRVANRSI
jgi:hypothetical protein